MSQESHISSDHVEEDNSDFMSPDPEFYRLSDREIVRQNEFWGHIKQLFWTHDHWDVKIYVDDSDTPFYVHAFILKIRCQKLVDLLNPHEVYTREAVLHFGDADPDVVRMMLEYMYTGEYSIEPYNATQSEKLCKHVRLYCLASDYELFELQDLCYDICARASREEWDCVSICESISELFHVVFFDADGPMIKLLAEIVPYHFDKLLRYKDFSDLLESDAEIREMFGTRLLLDRL